MAEHYPNCTKMGLQVQPDGRVRWRDLRRRLGQWRYGFAYRYGPGHEFSRLGILAADVERILGQMATEIKDWHYGPL